MQACDRGYGFYAKSEGRRSASQADAQLGALLALRAQVDRAAPATLASISAQIAACVATSVSLAQQALSATAESAARAVAELASATEEARAHVSSFMHDFYERKVFDLYLKFASDQDEAEYRRREESRRKQIEEAQALRTPEGTLRAVDLSIAQLEDAGAHGANRSPEYAPAREGLEHDRAQLRDAMAKSAPAREAAAKEADPLEALRAAGISLAADDAPARIAPGRSPGAVGRHQPT